MDEMEFEMRDREKPLKTFNYEVLIHLDRVLDYDPDEAWTGRRSFDSDFSGIPCDDPLPPECPAKFDYTWHLGLRDGERLARRTPVQDRLGGRLGRPDRSPPRGGFGGGLGLRQWPPASTFDMTRRSGGRREGQAGSSGGFAGGRRRQADAKTKGAPSSLNGTEAGAHGAQPATAFLGQEGGQYQAGGCVPRAGAAEGMGQEDDVQDGGWQEKLLQEMADLGVDTEVPRSSRDPMLLEVTLSQKELLPQVPLEPEAMCSGEGSNGPLDAVAGSSAQQKRSVEPTSATVEPSTHVEGTGDPNGGGQLTQRQGPVGGFALAAGKEGVQRCELGPGVEPIGLKEIAGEVAAPYGGPGHQGQQGQGLSGMKENRTSGEARRVDVPNGPGFDLNVGCDLMNEPQMVECEGNSVFISPHGNDQERSALKQADACLNKEGAGVKVPHRGISCFSIPLRKSLLCVPPPRIKHANGKKLQLAENGAAGQKERGRATLNSTVLPNLSADDEAADILLKASGVLGPDELPTDMARQKFGESLVCPLQVDVVGEMRTALGLSEDGGADRFAPLIHEADDYNDA
ncbi:unnamed protein product [Urochloa humidicola]